MTERRSSSSFAAGAAPLTEADKNLRALLNSAGVVLLAFEQQLHGGTLDPRQHSDLRILQEAVTLFDPAPASQTECPRESGGGQGGTPRKGPIAPSSGGAHSPFGRPAASLISGENRL